MPVNPQDIPALFEQFQPYMQGLDGTHEDFEFFYNTIEDMVRSGTPVASVAFPPQFVPLAGALYEYIKKKLNEAPPRPSQVQTEEAQVGSLREALALLTSGAREKLKALLTKNPALQEKLKEIGTHLQHSGVKLVARQPTGDAIGNLTPSQGVAEGKSTEVTR